MGISWQCFFNLRSCDTKVCQSIILRSYWRFNFFSESISKIAHKNFENSGDIFSIFRWIYTLNVHVLLITEAQVNLINIGAFRYISPKSLNKLKLLSIVALKSVEKFICLTIGYQKLWCCSSRSPYLIPLCFFEWGILIEQNTH